MGIFRSKPPEPTADELFHAYTLDIEKLIAARSKVWEELQVHRRKELIGDITRLDTMIELAQKTIIRLKEKQAKQEEAK